MGPIISLPFSLSRRWLEKTPVNNLRLSSFVKAIAGTRKMPLSRTGGAEKNKLWFQNICSGWNQFWISFRYLQFRVHAPTKFQVIVSIFPFLPWRYYIMMYVEILKVDKFECTQILSLFKLMSAPGLGFLSTRKWFIFNWCPLDIIFLVIVFDWECRHHNPPKCVSMRTQAGKCTQIL